MTLSEASPAPASHPSTDMESFHAHLLKSKRVLALLGAGLSASSGLPTFRGAGGLWRNRQATALATPEAFVAAPDLVWQFYSYRRHMSLNAEPNAAHYALAEYAKRNNDFVTLSQNVDGLSPRAGHPASQLHLLHGSLFDVKCVECGYVERDNFTDPIVPDLAIPTSGPQPEPSSGSSSKPDGSEASAALIGAISHQIDGRRQQQQQQQQQQQRSSELDISNAATPLPGLEVSQLPQCPECRTALLRPGVVWFGEALPEDTMARVDAFVEQPGATIDLILVIGTSSQVYPAAGYVWAARDKGARVAVVNMDAADAPGGRRGALGADDWMFCGDAAVLVPEMLKPVIG